MKHICIVGSLNIRETPGITGKRIGQLKRNERVTLKPGGEHVGRYFWVELERGGWCAMNVVNSPFTYLEPVADRFYFEYHPCDFTRHVTQEYGANVKYYNTFYKAGSRYHDKGHQGIDYGCKFREIIRAVAPGVVYKIIDERLPKRDGGHNFGVHVRVSHRDNYQTYYCHLDDYNHSLAEGQAVEAGHILGVAGTTGNSTGVHLHFVLLENGVMIDPTSYIGMCE